MPRIKVDFDKLCEAFPEAAQIRVLPRKKKKALKKKISRMLIDLLSYESHRIMAQFVEDQIFNDVFEKMDEALNDLESIVETKNC